MKPIYKMLVAGMLATATASPVLQARPELGRSASPLVHVSARITTRPGVQVTDALAYRILQEASGEFEAQMELSLSVEFLMNEYRAGKLSISYLGFDGAVHVFRVTYGGGFIIVGIEDI
jgi:hypothetical protein